MSLTLLLALPLLVLGLIGAKALVAGLRVRRRGDEPHCWRCDYRLTGIATGAGERCPECGTPLDGRNVARGERYRVPGLAIRGGVLLLATLAPLAGLAWREARGYDWYRVRPAGWLVSDVEKGGSLRAMRELMRRHKAGSLGGGSRDRLIAAALAEQAKPTAGPIGYELAEFLDSAVTLGQMSDAQRQQFFEQCAVLSLDVRPRVNLGEQVPFTIKEASRTSGGRRWVMVDEIDLQSDDGTRRNIGGSSKFSGLGAGGSTGGSFKANHPGEHTLTARVRVSVYRGSNFEDVDPSRLDHRRTVTLTAKYEVIDPSDAPTTAAASGAGEIKLVNDPAVGSSLRAVIRPIDFRHAAGASIRGTLDVGQAPANAALEVRLRAGDVEYDMGRVILHAGQRGGQVQLFTRNRDPIDPAIAKVDVILRGSPAAARETVDLMETWVGEQELKDVPVASLNTGSRP